MSKLERDFFKFGIVMLGLMLLAAIIGIGATLYYDGNLFPATGDPFKMGRADGVKFILPLLSLLVMLRWAKYLWDVWRLRRTMKKHVVKEKTFLNDGQGGFE